MSLARIITSTPERVSALVEYLRSRGYTVETLDPGAARTVPADLEVDAEGCRGEEAMSRACRAADVRSQTRRPVAYDITGRPVAFADDEEEKEPPTKRSNAMAEAWRGLSSVAREMIENLRLSVGRLGEWFSEGRRSLEEFRAQKQPPRCLEEEEKQHERKVEMLAREAENARRQQELEAERAAEQLRRQREEEVHQAAEARLRREREQAAQTAARERLRQQEEEAQREELAERERQLLERYRREAHRDVVQERFDVEQSQARQRVASAETRLEQREIPRPAPSRRSRRDGDWSKAAAVAVGLALLVTLAYAAYANRRPASPLSIRALVRSQSVSQTVPFGAATAAPSPAPALSRDARQSVSNSKLPQADVASAPSPAPGPALRTKRRHRSRSADNTVADDEVVVYHKPTSPSRAASTANSSGPKHISDLEP